MARMFATGRPSAVQKEARLWSEQQQAIFRWFERGDDSALPVSRMDASSHLVVRARAGTGKTTTIIEGINRAPEQNILLCAFNKRIAEELNSRITNTHAQAKTLHALGYAAIRQQWRVSVAQGSARADVLTNKVVPFETPKPIRRLVSSLHTKARDMFGRVPTVPEMTRLAFFFDYVPDDSWRDYDLEWVASRAVQAMMLARDREPDTEVGIDFADMIFLPLVHNLLPALYDLIVVDEAQDLTLAQLDMAQRSLQKGSGRICIVGDDRQAIYGFRGADSQSLDRLKGELGAVEMPLTVTYRCGQAIVERAQKLVPDIQAGPTNPQGEVVSVIPEKLTAEVQPGDFILSRLNAPLVSITLALLRQGVKARMAGRDIGAGLLTVLRRLHCSEQSSMQDILRKVSEWEMKTVAKQFAYGQVELVDRTRDQAATLYALGEGLETWAQLVQRCESLFIDDPEAKTVLCSSVHKAKGLEADRVYILQGTLYRRGVTVEEQNIEYVAVTRAKTLLGIVQ